MANTNLLGREVEQEVRESLTHEFGVRFGPKRLPLLSGGQFHFDAVSPDEQIVAAIKSSRGTTRGGKPPTGAIKAAIADLYYLTLVRADRRLLILTDPGFHERLSRDLRQRIAPGLELKHVALSPELNERVQAALDFASNEMRSKSDEME
jgi:hypothetical protein